MKVDSLSIHFKMSMISSRTKHESFDSFGSHTQLLIGNFPIFLCNEPILSSIFIFFKYLKQFLIYDQNIRRTLLTKQIYMSAKLFFLQIQRILIN